MKRSEYRKIAQSRIAKYGIANANAIVQPGDVIAVWFSCGAASAVAAKRAIDQYGKVATIRIMNNPVQEEDEDNRRFLSDVQAWLGQQIEIVTSDAFPSQSAVDVWESRSYMAGVHGAPCTVELKKRARQAWEADNHHDWLVFGYTAEEEMRHELFALTERDNILPILIQEGIRKQDCYRIIAEAGLRLPHIYDLGYPNANCIGCVKATSATYWNHVRKMHPAVFAERAEQSRRIGARLVRWRGKRIFLDELPLRAYGAPLHSMSIQCNAFCQIDE